MVVKQPKFAIAITCQTSGGQAHRTTGGLTIVELMVAILIISILGVVVAGPIMKGRIDSAKWSEGRAIMGSIATGIRACVGEKGVAPPTGTLDEEAVQRALGFTAQDLDSTYFEPGDFEISSVTYDINSEVALQFLITATRVELTPDKWTLNEQGQWGN